MKSGDYIEFRFNCKIVVAIFNTIADGMLYTSECTENGYYFEGKTYKYSEVQELKQTTDFAKKSIAYARKEEERRKAVEDFFEKVRSGEAKVLTLEAVKRLKGKKILFSAYTDNPRELNVAEIGELVNEWDLIKDIPDEHEGFKTRGEYLSYYFPKMKKSSQNTYLLFDTNGKNTCMSLTDMWRCFYDEPTITFTDADREVYYIEL